MLLIRGFQPQVEGGDGGAHVDADGQACQHLHRQGEHPGEQGGNQQLQQVPEQEADQQEEQVLFLVLHQLLAAADAEEDPAFRLIRQDVVCQGMAQGGHRAGHNHQQGNRQGHVVAPLQGLQLHLGIRGPVNRQQQVNEQGDAGQHPQQYLQDDQQLQPDGPEKPVHPAEHGAYRIIQALQPVQQPLVHAQGQAGCDQPGQEFQSPDGPEAGAVQEGPDLIQDQLF